jgi:hypothetical protein
VGRNLAVDPHEIANQSCQLLAARGQELVDRRAYFDRGATHAGTASLCGLDVSAPRVESKSPACPLDTRLADARLIELFVPIAQLIFPNRPPYVPHARHSTR